MTAMLMVSGVCAFGDGWETFSLKVDGFSISMPGHVTESQHSMAIQGLSINYKSFTASVNQTRCIVAIIDLPPTMSPRMHDPFLGSITTGFLSSIPGKTLSDQVVVTGSLSGRYTTHVSGDRKVGLRILEQDRRVYVFSFTARKADFNQVENRFMHSIELAGKRS